MISVYDSAELFIDSPAEIALLPLVGFTPSSYGTTELLITEICKRVTDQLPVETFLLPPWPYGTLPENDERAGVMVLHYETMALVVHDIVKSLFDHGIKKIVVINCLGSVNSSSALPDENSIVKTAVRQLNYENPELSAIWVQPFRVSGEHLKRLYGIEVTNEIVEKSILDYLFEHKGATESEDERAVWKEYANSISACNGQENEDAIGEKAFAEIIEAVVDYVMKTFSSIAMIKDIKKSGD